MKNTFREKKFLRKVFFNSAAYTQVSSIRVGGALCFALQIVSRQKMSGVRHSSYCSTGASTATSDLFKSFYLIKLRG